MENEQECTMDDLINSETNIEDVNDINAKNEEVHNETKMVEDVHVVTDAEKPPEKFEPTTTDTHPDFNGTNGFADDDDFPECPPEFNPNDNHQDQVYNDNINHQEHDPIEQEFYPTEVPHAFNSIEIHEEHSFNNTQELPPVERGNENDGEILPIDLLHNEYPTVTPKEYLVENQEECNSSEARDRDSIEAQADYPIGIPGEFSADTMDEYESKQEHAEFPTETLIDFTPAEPKEESPTESHPEYNKNMTNEEFPHEIVNSPVAIKEQYPIEPHIEDNPTEELDLPPEPPAPLLEYNYPSHVDPTTESRDECNSNTRNGNPGMAIQENVQIKETHEGKVITERPQEIVLSLAQQDLNRSELQNENKPSEMHRENTTTESHVPIENIPMIVPQTSNPSPQEQNQLVMLTERKQDIINDVPPKEQVDVKDIHIVTMKNEDTNHKNHDKKAIDDAIVVDPLPGKENGKAADDTTTPTRNESFGNRVLHCLSQVPCASLIAWIILLVGLGGLTGGLLIGIRKTRDLVETDDLFWFMEFAVAGVVAGMFVFGTVLLCVGHISTDPTSRHIFHTTKRNLCAQGLNITMLIFSYIFGILWVLMTAIFGVPLYLLVNILIIQDNVDEINLLNYGLNEKKYTGEELNTFLIEVNRLLVIYITIFVSSLLITISMIHFLIVISSNLTHLKDTRLATLNAYSDHTDMQNSKHSVVDTTM